MQEEDEKDERGEKKETERKGRKISKEYFGMSANVTLYITACMRTWFTATANQRRNCGCKATLRGYWGSRSTEEWGNITVSSFKSQHHVGRDILITEFLVENDRLSNWFHPFLRHVKSYDLSVRDGRFLFIYTFIMAWSKWFHSASVEWAVPGVCLHTLAGWG